MLKWITNLSLCKMLPTIWGIHARYLVGTARTYMFTMICFSKQYFVVQHRIISNTNMWFKTILINKILRYFGVTWIIHNVCHPKLRCGDAHFKLYLNPNRIKFKWAFFLVVVAAWQSFFCVILVSSLLCNLTEELMILFWLQKSIRLCTRFGLNCYAR